MAVDTLAIKDDMKVALGVQKAAPSLWRLYYKRGGNPHCDLVFSLAGDIKDAIMRSKRYCMNMNYIFIHVEQFLHDLDKDEERYSNQDGV